MTASLPHYRFTVDDYEQMVAVGILREDDRVELIEGEIIAMSPIGPRHADCVAILARLLSRQAPDDVLITVQNPIRFPDDSEPQPDIALVRFGRYTRALPSPDDVFVVIEVADTSRGYDRDTKLPLYAAAGIAEAWLVDLSANRIERHTEPGPDGYQAIIRAGRGAVLASVVVPSLAIPVDAVLDLPDRADSPPSRVP